MRRCQVVDMKGFLPWLTAGYLAISFSMASPLSSHAVLKGTSRGGHKECPQYCCSPRTRELRRKSVLPSDSNVQTAPDLCTNCKRPLTDHEEVQIVPNNASDPQYLGWHFPPVNYCWPKIQTKQQRKRPSLLLQWRIWLQIYLGRMKKSPCCRRCEIIGNFKLLRI